MKQNSAKRTAVPPAHPGKWRPVLIAVTIALIALVCFLPVCHNSFINWDDNAYIFENDQLTRPLPGAIIYFFQLHYFLGSYTPVTMCIYAFAAHWWGMDPVIFHSLSVALHIINVLLVFWFIFLLGGRRVWVAALTAMLFGIHPMHVESVAWAAELKDLLYTAFFIGGLICYLKYTRPRSAEDTVAGHFHGNNRLLIYTFSFFILSVLSKPAAVTFPVMLLLIDLYERRPAGARQWMEKVPFIAVAVIMGIITLRGQTTYELMQEPFSLPERLVLACYALARYAAKLVLPTGLSIYYPYPGRAGGHLPYILYLAPALLLVVGYIVYRTRHICFIVFGSLFFLVNIALVLQVISPGMSMMADHYTYVPYIGLFFIIAMAFEKLYFDAPARLKAYRQPALITIFAFLVACAYLTSARTEAWKDESSIADDLELKYPHDPVTLNNKGFVLYSFRRYNDAIPYFQQAVQARRNYVFPYVNMSNCYLATGDMAAAANAVDSGLLHVSGNAALLNQAGYIRLLQHNYNDAIKFYNSAIAANKDSRNAYLGLAECYFEKKDYLSEVAVLDRGLEQLPGNPMLLNYKGYALFMMGKYKEAERFFMEALRVKPGFQAAATNLDNCRKAMNNPAQSR